ncbi:MAG: hypothetical protein QOI54_2283 [Actinomycetota bacterium]|jgi:hypothetical protein|nr:hypothetical protein [Actinomycetota bacterium]
MSDDARGEDLSGDDRSDGDRSSQDDMEDDDVSSGFRRSRKGQVAMSLSPQEARVIRHVLGEMLELLGPSESPDQDPLAAAVDIGTTTVVPDDSALARLFPDGYTDDPDASADFRRYTEPGLREAKRSAARTALATLGEPGGKRVLTTEESEAWLRALNDTRLVLGERLGITEDWDELVAGLSDGDPRLALFWVYDRLTYLQETLVRALW